MDFLLALAEDADDELEEDDDDDDEEPDRDEDDDDEEDDDDVDDLDEWRLLFRFGLLVSAIFKLLVFSMLVLAEF